MYARWLQGLITRQEDDGRTYDDLVRALGSREFTWFIPNDDNRLEDGRKLRAVFFNAVLRYKKGRTLISLNTVPCSVLEMLIGLAKRFDELVIETEADDHISCWFWLFIQNLHLDRFDDQNFDPGKVSVILNRLLDRTYNADGRGSIFPLGRTSTDARITEIWYQMMEYLDKNFEI